MLSWRDRYLKKLKDQIQNAQNIRSVEKSNFIYETYKNILIPHGRHIYDKAYGVAKSTVWPYPQYDHALPHWKCVLRLCAYFPCINIPDQEKDNQYSETTPSIRFHIYRIISRCTDNCRITLKEKNIYHMCKQEYSSD